MRLITKKRRTRGQAWIATILAGLVLFLNALAASPSLHELIHADAGRADHQCAVTLFAQGQVDSASVDLPILVPPPVIEAVPSVFAQVFSPFIAHLPAGRAPPALPSVS